MEGVPHRVLHIASGDLWAGAEVSTFHLLGALRRSKTVEVEAFLLNDGTLADRLDEAGVPTTVVSETRAGLVALARAVRKRAVSFDLVHGHRYKENLLALLSGRPWIATQHGMAEPRRGLAGLRGAAYLALDGAIKSMSARRIVAVSRDMGATLGARYGRKVAVVPNGIADPRDRVQPKPWADRPLRVGVLARLVPVKAIDLAIDALSGVPDVVLEIVGDGPERTRLEARVREAGLSDRVQFLGFLADPLPRVATWRALLVTSLHEGHPIGVLEAVALGTPVVTADLPGVLEIVGDDAGWRVPTREPAAWTAALLEVVGGGEGAARSARARAYYEARFSSERCAEAMADLYREVIEEVRRS